MKKKIFLLLGGILLLCGCGEKETKVTCKKTIEYEKQKVETSFIMYFGKDKILKHSTTHILESEMSKETYEEKKKEYDELKNDEEYKTTKFTFHDKERTVESDKNETYKVSNNEKNKYLASNYIKEYEDMSYKCTIEGSTRKELGLK